jgi:hypothetical protein
VGFSVRWEAPVAARSRQTPYDFELQSAVQQNLSGDELATYPNIGGCVVITLPHADGDRVPRLCEAIRGSFDQSLTSRGAPPAQLRFGAATLVETAQHALALARRF